MEKDKTKKKNIIAGFISSEKGQRFFNFAYSIGAAIVIWGALFKILHLPGGNTLLSIGMGTEVLMFLLTAFDRPPKEYKWEEVFPALADKKDTEHVPAEVDPVAAATVGAGSVTGVGGGGVIISGNIDPDMFGNVPEGVTVTSGAADGQAIDGDVSMHGAYAGGAIIQGVVGGGVGAGVTAEQSDKLTQTIDRMTDAAEQMSLFAEEMQHLRETTAALNNVSEILLRSYEAITQHSNEINDTSNGYVEQMQSLSRNISGLNTIYEIQLKSVSSQLDAIDRVNRGIKDIRDMYEKSAEQSSKYCEETEKMARYMQQLNQVYEKMITAMTINMYRPMMGAEQPMPAPAPEPEYE